MQEQVQMGKHVFQSVRRLFLRVTGKTVRDTCTIFGRHELISLICAFCTSLGCLLHMSHATKYLRNSGLSVRRFAVEFSNVELQALRFPKEINDVFLTQNNAFESLE